MIKALGGSFRDPSGFMYTHDGVLLRQINDCAASDFERLIDSGLYDTLTKRGELVTHEEVDAPEPLSGAWRTIRPERVRYVSYPYEWAFSQLKAAAMLTLRIQRTAIEHGMSLKDASAYNVQFIGCRPVFIDTLSFERLTVEKPWAAYRQFCQHFLGPLLLMMYGDPRFRHLTKGMIDGVPLDFVRRVLPRRTWLSWGILAHVHLHAGSQRRHEQDGATPDSTSVRPFSKRMHLALIESLERAVARTDLPRLRTEWGNYYNDTNYSADAMDAKESLVLAMANELGPTDKLIHDVGANTGRFSRLLAREGKYVVAHDIDEMAVEANYRNGSDTENASVLPLVLDIGNPTPAIGWALEERSSFVQRASGHLVVALALVHHIAITNNVPLPAIAAFFAGLAPRLLIEFVPKEDSQVQRLLATREDIFKDYTIDHFRTALSAHYRIKDEKPIAGTSRTLFALERLEPPG